MTISILFFAHLRELAKTDSIEMELGAINTVRDLLNEMSGTVPQELIDALRDETAMVSVNQRYAGWNASVDDGDEIGLLPPVSGG